MFFHLLIMEFEILMYIYIPPMNQTSLHHLAHLSLQKPPKKKTPSFDEKLIS